MFDIERFLELEDDRYYSPVELERLVGLSRHTLYAWIRRGKVQAIKVSGRIFVKGSELKGLVAAVG